MTRAGSPSRSGAALPSPPLASSLPRCRRAPGDPPRARAAPLTAPSLLPTLSAFQDRHDGSSNGNPRLPHLSAVSQHLYSPAPPLSHSGASDFQPPYFPPPYQPLPYSQSSDPYSHLGDPFSINPLHQPPPPPPSQQQSAWPGRQSQDPAGLAPHARPGLVPHLSALESGSAGGRRETYRRSELLLPHGHGLDASALADNLGLHDMAHQMEEVQVGCSCSPSDPTPRGQALPGCPPWPRAPLRSRAPSSLRIPALLAPSLHKTRLLSLFCP